jgi:hypothetical protein
MLEWEWNDYDDYNDKYMKLPWFAQWLAYFSNLEGLGILVKNGLLDPNLIYEMQYNSIILLWDKFLPITLGVRNKWSSPQMWGTVEYLYDEMRRIRAERGHGETGS